ncbi:cytochrome c [Candidatus Poriferisodalis sp.]|uniref:c-type cytochrome n=1 Tax=Candidatus Poriferisodalis sp. TaxID=3101277 RepID=UPI003B024DF4
MSRRKKLIVRVAIAAVTAAAAVGLTALIWSRRDIPEVHAGAEAHFKYGSIGSEGRAGVPYWIWMVLPDVFGDLLPDGPGEGYERFGFVFEDNAPKGRPIGTSYREDPVPLVGLNCALCHTGVVQAEGATGQAERRVILGMPAHQLDLQGYLRFLFAVAGDDRFDADRLLPAIERINPDFDWLDAQLYRFVVIPQTRSGLLEEDSRFEWMTQFPDFGPGRVDTFNPYKFGIHEIADNHPRVGTADFPPLWNQALKEGMWLHWDGNNDSVAERNRSAAIGAGATEDSLDTASLDRVAEWIGSLPAPAFPEAHIDRSLVPAGAEVYEQHCARCHSFDGELVGSVIDIGEIGTDPERLESFDEELAAEMNTLGRGRHWRFSRFRATNGYANLPLDGVWLRAPFLHNGSVPTLRDLLRPPEDRPIVFYRGNPAYDYDDVGFVSSRPSAGESQAEAPSGFRFDTTLRGNGNGGHLYGTDLSDGQIDALIEYLKTR